MHSKLTPLLEDSNITATLQMGVIGICWYTDGEIVSSNSPKTLLNFDDFTHSTEYNACVCITTPATDITLENENTHI